MDTQTLINLLFGLVAFLGGYIMHGLRDSLNNLSNADSQLLGKVQAMEVLVVGQYVKHADLREALVPMTTQLSRIETKLDNKMDKVHS